MWRAGPTAWISSISCHREAHAAPSIPRSGTWRRKGPANGCGSWQDSNLKRIVTVFTIGLEKEPAEMARKAAAAAEHPILKVKLDADRPVEKIEAIRAVRPDAASSSMPTRVGASNSWWRLPPGCTASA